MGDLLRDVPTGDRPRAAGRVMGDQPRPWATAEGRAYERLAQAHGSRLQAIDRGPHLRAT